MNIKGIFLGAMTVLALAAVTPAQAAMQRFWVVNWSHLDITNVYVMQDKSRGTRDLMGRDGVLDYNPDKVPDLVQVLQPVGSRCNVRIKIVGYPSESEDEYTAWTSGNICTPGQTFNVYDEDFGY